MNNYTMAISSFIRFDVVVFNTLEYAMKKDSYDVKGYVDRKKVITDEITENTPLKNCIANSGEAGQALLDKINDLLKTVYSDESTIVKLSQDGSELRVDYSQAITVFELVLPIHEEMKKIVQAHVVAAKNNNAFDEPDLSDLITKEEYFYRGLVNMLMFREFDHQFAEYNKARAEANGQITAQSNFIQNDINRIVKLFYFVRENAFARNAEYYSVIDPLFALIEMTGGRRDLPEGKKFPELFTEINKLTLEKARKFEDEWKPAYEKYINKFYEAAQKAQKGANA